MLITTPARRHKLRVQAQQAAQAADPGAEVRGSVHELMLAQLHEHRRTLKGIQSVQRKIEAKHAFLPVYDEYITGALAGGRGGQDLVLTTLMVWHFDTGSWARGLEIAEYASQHGLHMPDQYERDLTTVLLDEAADAALKGQMDGNVLGILSEIFVLTQNHDAPDQARAKFYKAIGYAHMGKTDAHDPDITALPLPAAEEAMDFLQAAYRLHAGVGVKKDMERLERRLKAATPGTD